MYSFLRPFDALEQMTFCPETTNVDQFIQMTHPQLTQNNETTNDLIQLMSVLATLDQQLTGSFKFNIESEMAQLKSPDKVMSELVIDLMAGTENPVSVIIDFINHIQSALTLYYFSDIIHTISVESYSRIIKHWRSVCSYAFVIRNIADRRHKRD